jgi:putative membrane protein
MQQDTPDGDMPEETAGSAAGSFVVDPEAHTGVDESTVVGVPVEAGADDATLVGVRGEPGAADADVPAGADDATVVGVPVEGGAAVGSAALAEIVRAAAAQAPQPAQEDVRAAQPAPAILDLPNEAIPAVEPEPGTLPVGSIPGAQARRAWSRVQAANWRLFLIRFLSAGIAVVLTVAVLPGLGFTGWEWGTFTQISVVFGLLNATVKPLLQFLVLRFIFSTYGIVVVVINALLLVLLASILENTFVAARPLSVLAGGALVGVLGLMLETLLGATPPVLDRDYKERNGLR